MPPFPEHASSEEIREMFARALMEVRDRITPLFDSADGMRADLERRGWSPTAADAVVLPWLQSMMALCTSREATQ